MSNSKENANDIPVNQATSQKLFNLGCALMTVAVLAIWWSSPLTDPVQLVTGVVILVLGCTPGLLWARNGNPWFPCFEISTLTCVVFYAIPLLSGKEELKDYPESVLEASGFIVIGYLLAAILFFNAVKTPRKPPAWAAMQLLPDNFQRYLPAGLLLNSAYIFVSRFFYAIPPELVGSVRALCFGIGTITAFIFACEWGRGRLSPAMKALFVSCTAAQIICLFSELYLITGISILILSGIGYTYTRRKLPWLAVCLCLPVIAVLHNGKTEMRRIYWDKTASLPGLFELPAFYRQWVDYGLQKSSSADSPGLASKLAERASLFQMLCLSVNQVPSSRPYLGGESYIDIPAQILPRFLWPDKPSSLLSNVRLAIYFNLVDPNDAYSTSIAFGVIAEAYVNLGWLGVIVLGALTGAIFKQLALRSIDSPMFSAIGIFMILLTAWSFQAELVMATWLTSLFQASAISIVIPLAWKKFFGSA